MKPIKIYLLLAAILASSGCSSPKTLKNQSAFNATLEEQCKILNKKRTTVQRLKLNPKIYSAKKNRQNSTVTVTARNNAFKSISRTIASRDSSVPQKIPEVMYTHIEMTTEEKLESSPITRRNAPVKINSPQSFDIQISAPEVLTSENKIFSQSYFAPFAIALSGILSMVALISLQNKSKRISRWAFENSSAARGLIVSAHFVTGSCAGLIGKYLAGDGLIFSESIAYIPTLVVSAAALLYPSAAPRDYLRRKMHDVALFSAGAVLVMYAANTYSIQSQAEVSANYGFAKSNLSVDPVSTNYSLSEYGVQGSPEKKNVVGKIALTLLAVAAFAALGYGLAALSCQIACSGSSAAAAVVAIGGGIGLVALFVFTIRSIFGKTKRKKKQKVELQEI